MLKVGQTVRVAGRRLSGQGFRRQDHHHRAADHHRYAQHPCSGHDRQSRSHPQARHVHDHDGGAAGQAGGGHRSGDRGRLHAVRRFGVPDHREEGGRRQDQPDRGSHLRADRQPDRRPGRNPQRPEGRRSRGRGRPAQAAIGRRGGDLDRRSRRRFRQTRRVTDVRRALRWSGPTFSSSGRCCRWSSAC